MINKRKYLFLMITFPDVRNSSNMYTDMVEEFISQGHEVYVATLNEDKRLGTYVENINGIKILNIYAGRYFNTNFIRKGVTLLNIGRSFTKNILKIWGNEDFDSVLYPTPPITFQKVVSALRRKMQFKSYLILRDIFPQNAKDMGLIKVPFLFKYFRYLESKLYSVSDFIGCMSPGNIEYINIHNPEVLKQKISLLPNWKKIPKDIPNKPTAEERSSLLEKYGIDGEYIAIFGGVHGVSQELEFLLELALRCVKLKDVRFVFIGEGNQKAYLQDIVERKKISNVIFLDRINRKDYTSLLACSDIGLVNLSRKFTIPNIPSKTMDYFEYGIPVLASVDKCTDYRDFILRDRAGLCSITGDIDTYFKNFLYFYESVDRRKKFGSEGRRFIEKDYNVRTCYEIIYKRLESKGYDKN